MCKIWNLYVKNLLLDLGSVVVSALASYTRGPEFADMPSNADYEGIFIEALYYLNPYVFCANTYNDKHNLPG